MDWKQRWERACRWALPRPNIAPQEEDAQRKIQTRRAYLLAMLTTCNLMVALFLLPLCLSLRPVGVCLAAWGLFVATQLVSGALNRFGRIMGAAVVAIVGMQALHTLLFVYMPPQAFYLGCLLYLSIAVQIAQSGFLLGRNAPFAVSAYSICLISLHMLLNLETLAQRMGMETPPFIGLFLLADALLLMMALLIHLDIANMEDALLRADHLQQEQAHISSHAGSLVEMNAELLSVHAQLEVRNQDLTQMQEQLEQRNRLLQETQAQMEALYRIQEERSRHLEALATTDGMTGLANHRSFQEEWQRQIARAERYRSPLSLLLFDVDHFKKYNDAFGHPAGDEVLRTVGRLLRTITREGDYPARYGGEEFAVILPDQDAETAQTVGERIREVIVSHTFAHREITISVGVAQHIASEAAGATIQRVDVALYESKAAGRNRVTYLPTEGECPVALQVGSWAVDQEAGQDSDRTDTPAFEVVQATEETPPARRQTPFETLRLLSWQFGGLEGMLQDPLEPTLAALLDILDRRNGEPTGHAERVTRYTIRLAQELSALYEERRDERPLLPYLTPFDFKTLAYGALLHDLGKMGIPEATLRKRGDLTEAEWRQIRRHPLVGASLLKGYPTLEAALPIVRYHHECWDGSGYPQGLKGETIPLSARIFALCDTFENLTTDKSYRKRFDFAAACQEIRSRAGTQFDPDAVTAFLRIPSEEWLRLSEPIAEPECDAFADAA